jgi:hypothetical protein
MTRADFFEWLRDRIWPTLVPHPKAGTQANFEWPATLIAPDDTFESAHQTLKEELQSEDERIKVVEAKLVNVSSLTPVAMTIFVAMITFLTSGKVAIFTRTSIWVVIVFGGYIALQFLLAIRAAIKGLARRPFQRLSLEDVLPVGKESKRDYLQRACKEIADAITGNRRGIDQKVSQLALCHESILNAVLALLILLLILLAIVAAQPR